ncbi:hypothetical protein AT15_05605 [Kosmotoga arenicorallina S304]|uniref:Glycoside hydrolase family 38 N-terminal domain-containing protein n=1 Tax=Kosmotoga arenicorallina S304 TaxID=1453497 RepID=A0A182C7G1_9BACT|nr:hypothetical protein [Kosmotoga arenicorallina]OAA31549.1 hypothetical protein AT15_05605 [Kosmotoga arenicorallina S304]
MKRILFEGNGITLEVLITDLISIQDKRLMIFKSNSRGVLKVFSSGDLLSDAVLENNSIELLIDNVDEIELLFNSPAMEFRKKLKLPSPKRLELHLLMFSHSDLGYTAPLSKVEELQYQYTSTALNFYEKSLKYSEASRFRWNVETTWALNCFAERANRSELAKFTDLAKKGEFGIGAIYLHHYTDRTPFEELYHSLNPLRRLIKKGIEPKSAFLSDVPGCSEGFLELLAAHGVENLFMSINNFVAPFLEFTHLKTPFWWKLKSGRRILTWFTHDPKYAYIEGYKFFDKDYKTLKESILNKYEELSELSYEFPLYPIPMAIDNMPPVFKPVELIDRWNKEWKNPIVKTSVIDDFFKALRRELETTRIDSTKGNFNGWWTSNVLAYPRENRLSTISFAQLHEASALDSFSGSFIENAINDEFIRLSGFDEHSGGGGLYLSKDPEDILKAVSEGYGWVVKTHKHSSEILKALRENIFGIGNKLVVFNPVAMERNTLASFETDEIRGKRVKLIDLSTGESMPILCYNDLVIFETGTIESFGYKCYSLEIESEAEMPKWHSGSITLENDYYRIEFDEYGNIRSLIDTQTRKELVLNERSLGKFLVARQAINPADNLVNAINHDELYTGKSSSKLVEPYLPVKCHWKMIKGTAGTLVIFEPESPFIKPFVKAYLIPKNLKEIRIHLRINYVYDIGPSDFMYLEMPFNLDRPKAFYKSPGEISEITEQIPGSALDAITTVGGIELKTKEQSIQIGLCGINLVDFGEPSPLTFKKEINVSGELFLRLFNTNLQNRFASPYFNGEPIEFDVLLTTGGKLSRVEKDALFPLTAFKASPKANTNCFLECRGLENSEFLFIESEKGKLNFAIKETAGEKREIFIKNPRTNTVFKRIIKPFEFFKGSVENEPYKS